MEDKKASGRPFHSYRNRHGMNSNINFITIFVGLTKFEPQVVCVPIVVRAPEFEPSF